MPAYSKTPLKKKLGIRPGDVTLIYNFSGNYWKELGVDVTDYNIRIRARKDTVQFMHLFVLTQQELFNCIHKYKPLLIKDGMMWVSWPKGRSGIDTDLKRDFIRESLLEAGLVDVKVASFNETWSGLKFVYRLKDR